MPDPPGRARELVVLAALLAALATKLFVAFVPELLFSLFAAFAADLGHALAILARLFTALAAGCSRLLGSKLVRGAAFVGSLTALAHDLAPLLVVHRRRSPLTCALH